MPPKKAASPASKRATSANKGSNKTTKKWSKGKSRDPLQNAVMFDEFSMEKLEKEVPKYKLITPSVISDRLKISVAVAGDGLVMLAEKGVIKLVSSSAKFKIYTRATEA